MNRLSVHEQMIEVAKVIALRGTCSRLQVGAVAARGGRILATGYNGAPAGQTHCEHEDDSACSVAVHAEANAIVFAARQGTVIDKADLYCTHAPCLACASLIINAGISSVWYDVPYRLTYGIDALIVAGVPVTRLSKTDDSSPQPAPASTVPIGSGR